MTNSIESAPIIDIASLRGGSEDISRIGAALDRACCEYGFFYVTGHRHRPCPVRAADDARARVFRFTVANRRWVSRWRMAGARGADIFPSMVS